MLLFLFNPKGFNEPVVCKKNKWIITNTIIRNGIIKCKQKNRVNVGLLIENPPQIHWTISVPIYGIAEIKFVITNDPQNDICPHGNTYPIKAVPIITNKIITPIFQVFFIINLL